MTSHLETRIAERVAALRADLVALRRDFHMHPELSHAERRTGQVIAERLTALGLRVRSGVGGHGVVADLEGALPGPLLAYRADMDALPMQDMLDTAYRSQNPGVKHACGHDAHMTIALGVAEVLVDLRETWPGTVRFIFQPAEESLDGARQMLAAGVLDPPPEAILGLHMFPIPVGQVGLADEVCLVGMEEFRVRLYSPAGHLDTLMTKAASALRALSTARAPTGPTTFAALVQSMQTSDAHQDTVLVSCWPRYPEAAMRGEHLLGLVSIPRAVLRQQVRAQIHRVLNAVTAEMGAAYDLTYTFDNPPTKNDAGLVREFLPIAQDVVGAANVLRFRAPYPFAHEDFALYQQHAPGLLLWLGSANPKRGLTALLHAPDFDVDEDALTIGTRLMATALLRVARARSAA